jgi:8-oxo-dGTP diphosphatase
VYEHAAVRLHFFRIREWRGTPQGLEAQRFAFQVPGCETVSPMLPANGPILKAVGLPQVYGITNATEIGVEKFMDGLEAALTKGLRLVQVRDKEMPMEQRSAFARAVLARCRVHGARVLVNGTAELAARCGADGIHLTSQHLMQTDARPALSLVGASVHSRDQLDHAVKIGCDFAVLGPINPTATHPGADTLGWDGFARIAIGAGIPVYAIGGMQATDVYSAAWQAGAHGVAMMRGAWE